MEEERWEREKEQALTHSSFPRYGRKLTVLVLRRTPNPKPAHTPAAPPTHKTRLQDHDTMPLFDIIRALMSF
jgi:hypothetical protein